MSDDRLRELERRWRETGATEDEAQYLAERVRAGELEAARLRLAAFLGSTSASLATGETSVPLPMDTWIVRLHRFGAQAVVRAVVAMARELRPMWERLRAREIGGDDAITALRRAEEWCLEPTRERAARADLAAQHLAGVLDVLPDQVTAVEGTAMAVAHWAAETASTQSLEDALSGASLALAATEEQGLRQAIRRELLP